MTPVGGNRDSIDGICLQAASQTRTVRQNLADSLEIQCRIGREGHYMYSVTDLLLLYAVVFDRIPSVDDLSTRCDYFRARG